MAIARIRPLSFIALVAALGACDTLSEPLAVEEGRSPEVPPAVAATRTEAGNGAFLRILTRNIYLGGSTGPLFAADFSDIPALLAAVNTFWAQVQATDIHERAIAMADEIAVIDPHVVALQEVARYAVLDGTLSPVGGVDFLDVIVTALANRGLDYRVAFRQEDTNGTLPLSIDLSTMRPDRLLNFVVGEATLVRGDVEVQDAVGGNYAAKIAIPTPLGPVTVQRGWTRVTLNFKGVPHHVHNTHLETQGLRPVHDGQADELLGSVLAGLDGVTIVTGDLNSDAEAVEGDRSWTPTYGRFIQAGFVDAWTEATGRRDVGYTCCHDPDLRNDVPSLDERIDFVMVRAASEMPGWNLLPGAVRMAVLGDQDADRTDSGLWPADHAGLFAALQIPRGLLQD